MATKVISRPHNQNKATGPTPTLIAALREDNRALVLEILRLNPFAPRLGTITDEAVSFRQRLVFADESIRTLILRHVLLDESARNPFNFKKKGKKQIRPQQLSAEEEDLPIPKGLGIVGTRLLLRREDTSVVREQVNAAAPPLANLRSSQMDVRPDAQGTAEVIFDPTLASSSAAATFDDVDDRDFTDDADVVVYFLRPTTVHARAVAAKIRKFQQHSAIRAKQLDRGGMHHRILFLPHSSALCERILLDEGILPMDSVSVHTLPVDLTPLDGDVLSLETAHVIRECDVEGCPSDSVTAVARSLIKIQDVCGTIPRVQSLGPLGEAVVSKMMDLRLEEYSPFNDEDDRNPAASFATQDGADVGAGIGGGLLAFSSAPEISALIVIDRKVDMVTPMLTPLTYEGLLDEFFGINIGFIKVDESIVEPPDETPTDEIPSSPTPKTSLGPRMVPLPLNDADTLYIEVRDQHVEKFGSFLQGQAKALKESHSNFTDKNKDLSEIHQFVKQIPIFTQNLRSLTNHIYLAELVKHATEASEFRQRWQTERSMVESETCYDMLEDLIACQDPPYRILRLLCLQSLTGGGIKSSKFDSLRREVVQTYGYEFLFVLQNLEKVGMLRRRETLWMDSASPFGNLRKLLVLINAEVNTLDPDDVSYVSSGYAPLTARLIQAASSQGWSGKEDALKELPGRLIDIYQRSPPEDLVTAMKRSSGSNLALAKKGFLDSTKSDKKPVLLVYFVGGVTFMEIAALRFLSRRQSFPFTIMVCTTKMINGSTFLRSLG